MKAEIHPQYQKIEAICVCGNKFEVGTILESLNIDICSACHPFFTGQQKMLDTEGRIERFNKRYKK